MGHARLASIALVAALGATTGCSALIGISDVPTPGDGGAGTTGNGNGNGGTGADVSSFVGTWSTSTGVLALRCETTPNPYSTTQPVTASLVVTKGTSSDLVFTTSTCAILANVAGDTATILPGQSCSTTSANETDTYNYTSGTFVVAAGGATAVLKVAASVSVSTYPQIPCAVAEQDPYTKVK